MLLLSPLAVGVLAVNIWLERRRDCVANGSAGAGRPNGLALSEYVVNAWRLNAVNWGLLFVLALGALGASLCWLTAMSGALSTVHKASGGGGGGGPPSPPWWPPAAPAPARAAPPALAAAGMAHDLADAGCPAGCADLGILAPALGLPWHCLCGGAWLLGGLEESLTTAVRQLWIALSGSLCLFVGSSWLFGYLSAQGAHAARDLEMLLRAGAV